MESAIGLALMFNAFIAAAPVREQECDQGGHDEEQDLLEPPRLAFSIRATIESKGTTDCRSILKFS
jgi:hypothetical protein